RITGVEVDLSVSFARDGRAIVEARVPSDDVDPGATVPLTVRLRHYGTPDETRVVPVTIPAEAAGTDLELAVLPGDDVTLEHPDPRNLEDILQNARLSLPATSLVVSMRLPSRGLRFEGHVARALPASAIDALTEANGSAPAQPFPTDLRVQTDAGHVLFGS